MLGLCTTNCNAVDTHGWLADAHRDTLAFFTAGTDAGIEFEIVANHGYPGEYVRAITN